MSDTNELPPEIKSLVAQCEANVSSFDNNQMSEALYFAECTFHELDALRAEVSNLKELQRREAHDWAEAHNALLTATGTVVDDSGQPTLIELVARLVAERDALRELQKWHPCEVAATWPEGVTVLVRQKWNHLPCYYYKIESHWRPDWIGEFFKYQNCVTDFQLLTKGTDDAHST